jgi:hypothetical protein
MIFAPIAGSRSGKRRVGLAIEIIMLRTTYRTRGDRNRLKGEQKEEKWSRSRDVLLILKSFGF